MLWSFIEICTPHKENSDFQVLEQCAYQTVEPNAYQTVESKFTLVQDLRPTTKKINLKYVWSFNGNALI